MREDRQHKIFKPRRELKSWLVIILSAVLIHLAFMVLFKTDYLKVFERKDIGRSSLKTDAGSSSSSQRKFSFIEIQSGKTRESKSKPVIELEEDPMEEVYDFIYEVPPVPEPESGGYTTSGKSTDSSGNGVRSGITKPKPLFIPWPEYPEGVDSQFNGKVILRLYVNTQGEVEEIEIVSGLGSEALNRRAIEAAGKIRFTPGERDGKPSPMWVRISIGFQSR